MNKFQIFAEDAAATEETSAAATEAEAPAKKYTDEDVNRIIDEKFAKWERSRSAKEAEKIKQAQEAEKLKNMTEAEKTNKRLEELEKQLESYRAKEAATAMEKEARKMFQAADISVPDGLVSLCVSDTAEETKAKVEDMIKVIRDEAKRLTKGVIGKSEPKTGSTKKLTREQILAISDQRERQKKMRENWELFGGK